MNSVVLMKAYLEQRLLSYEMTETVSKPLKKLFVSVQANVVEKGINPSFHPLPKGT